ncbi:hypothetical protein GBZ26_05815 [Azospirillum formosense]|uniref:Uncharacterized protein n=1 Tax=Azospirillum formosense TaxID=861533 RepID=A0ABX2L0M4_9PROT|nr:hypothetical protein [Azospirillum formosense]MBY3757733.1 hypothetical protein [Azospirillum formosense]NUB18735.1 hypothetical protein [Azospirillum formosense]
MQLSGNVKSGEFSFNSNGLGEGLLLVIGLALLAGAATAGEEMVRRWFNSPRQHPVLPHTS